MYTDRGAASSQCEPQFDTYLPAPALRARGLDPVSGRHRRGSARRLTWLPASAWTGPFRCRSREVVSNLVAGGRFELYSAYPIRVPMVLARNRRTGTRQRPDAAPLIILISGTC